MISTLKRRLSNPIIIAPPKENLQAMKSLEEIIILCRFLLGFAGILAALLQKGDEGIDSTSFAISFFLVIIFITSNIAFYFFNRMITSPDDQLKLGIISLVTDATVVFGIIFVNIDLYLTTIHAGFIFVIIEAVLRFGMKGTIAMCVIFPIGLGMVMILGKSRYGIEFDLLGSYIFWNGIMLSVALIFGMVVRGSQQERKLNEQLVKEKALTEERQRIAHDLHDTVIKTLHGITLETYLLKKRLTIPENKEKAQYIERICQQSGSELRNIIYALREEDAETGIATKICDIINQWNEASDIEISLDIKGEDLKLPLNINYNIRNILSEALTNIEKHSGADKVSLSVEISEDELYLAIHDNGRGIKRDITNLKDIADSGSFGLLGMKERTQQLGGEFSITNDRGTRLQISIPLAKSGQY